MKLVFDKPLKNNIQDNKTTFMDISQINCQLSNWANAQHNISIKNDMASNADIKD